MSYHSFGGFGATPLGSLGEVIPLSSDDLMPAESQVVTQFTSDNVVPTWSMSAAKTFLLNEGLDLKSWTRSGTGPARHTVKVALEQSKYVPAIQRNIKAAFVAQGGRGARGFSSTSPYGTRPTSGSHAAPAPPSTPTPTPTPRRLGRPSGAGGDPPPATTTTTTPSTPAESDAGESPVGKIVLVTGGVLLVGSLVLLGVKKLRDRRAASSLEQLAANTVHRVLNPRQRQQRRRRRRNVAPRDDVVTMRRTLLDAAETWFMYPDTVFGVPRWLVKAAQDAGYAKRDLSSFLRERGSSRVRDDVLEQLEHASQSQLQRYYATGE